MIEQVKDLVIEGPSGAAWSLLKYMDQMPYPPPPCPDTVNPSLWRQTTLNCSAGKAGVPQQRHGHARPRRARCDPAGPLELVREGRIPVPDGTPDYLWFWTLIDDGNPNFPIVTPKDPLLPQMESSRPAAAATENVAKKRRWGIAPPVLKGC